MPIIITSKGKLVIKRYSKLEQLYFKLCELNRKQHEYLQRVIEDATSFYNFPNGKIETT